MSLPNLSHGKQKLEIKSNLKFTWLIRNKFLMDINWQELTTLYSVRILSYINYLQAIINNWTFKKFFLVISGGIKVN